MSTDIRALTREELEAENLRLSRLLEAAGHEAARRAILKAENDAQHRGLLALSRSEANSNLRHARQTESSALDAKAQHRQEMDDLASHLIQSQDLVSELQASQLALRASEERLALAFEASGSLGWWDWDIPNDRIYTSPLFARMYGVDPSLAAEGASLTIFIEGIHPDDRDWVGAKIEEVLATGGEFAEEYRLLQKDGTVLWIYARGRCYLDKQGKPLRYPGVSIDITARKQSELRKVALIELGDRLRDTQDIGAIARTAAEIMARHLNATRAGFGIVDQVRETVQLQPDWRKEGVQSLAGLHHFRDYGSFIDDLKRGELVIIDDVTTDPRTQGNAQALLDIGIRVLVNVPIIEHGRFVTVVFVHYDKPHTWTDEELDFIRSVADRTQAAIGRIRAEEQQRFLNRELSHRLKNNLAMVQAIVAQTLRNAPDLPSAKEALNSRLISLSRAHDLLLSGDTGTTNIRAIIEGALALHDDGQGRIRMNGPPLEIGPAASLSLSLILHELATNAVKYGALSVSQGYVQVEWGLAENENKDEDIFSFTWSEHDGPPVEKPTSRGFGTRLIERGLAGSIEGKVRLDYNPDGLVCHLSAPMMWIGQLD